MSAPPGHPRGTGRPARLARLGFRDVAGVERALDELGLADTAAGDLVVAELARVADPNIALAALRRLVEAQPRAGDLLGPLADHAGLRVRLLAVLGASGALGDFLVRHPGDWELLADDVGAAARPSALGLRRDLLAAVGADPDGPPDRSRAGDDTAATLDRLRVAYRRHVLQLAARDLTAGLAVEDVAGELADLATAALAAGLAVAAAGRGPAGPVRLAVIALGKCGARELNYASDVDVVFVAGAPPGGDDDAAIRAGTRLAEGLIRACAEVTGEGRLFPVDTGLRPEGRDGPLVRSLASHLAYYERWARTWEFQALLKARPVAGDPELGAAYRDRLAPMVWAASARPGFVADVQEMRRRVERSVPPAELDRQLKLGPGGLRDVEFAVQLLQLVHGRADESLRAPDTLTALAALSAAGYVGRSDGAELAAAYRWLRAAEHRLQLQRLRRAHTVPLDPGERVWLARGLGYPDLAAFDDDWRRRRAEVRRLHEKLFYRPLLTATARLRTDDLRLAPEAAERRLAALGFRDTRAALEHLRALSSGLSRAAAIQRTLLPVVLADLADGFDPDAGLLAFRQVSEALGDSPWYLRLLRDAGATAERLARVLATSRYATDLLGRAPEAMALLTDDAGLAPRSSEALAAELRAVALRNPADRSGRVGFARSLRRQELLRIACADVLGRLDAHAVGAALTGVTLAVLDAALATAVDAEELATGAPLPVRIAVLGLGRLGGGELGYGSDADVLFVHEPEPGVADAAAAAAAHRVAEEMRRLLGEPAPDPPLVVDAGLRPEGRQGPLTRSLASYTAYHARWARPWEAQALLRAAPAAGDPELAGRFLAGVADPLRYPAALDPAAVEELRRLKRRMETERVRPGSRERDLKLGPGGLADVEWVAQLLQLRHAHAHPGLRVTGTAAALRAACTAGLLAPEDGEVLVRAWSLAAAARNALTHVTGRSGDLLPEGDRELGGIAVLLGYPPGQAEALRHDRRRLARRARAVAERLLYGGEPG